MFSARSRAAAAAATEVIAALPRLPQGSDSAERFSWASCCCCCRKRAAAAALLLLLFPPPPGWWSGVCCGVAAAASDFARRPEDAERVIAAGRAPPGVRAPPAWLIRRWGGSCGVGPATAGEEPAEGVVVGVAVEEDEATARPSAIAALSAAATDAARASAEAAEGRT